MLICVLPCAFSVPALDQTGGMEVVLQALEVHQAEEIVCDPALQILERSASG